MFLKSIKAFGFKSFADKTELDFNKGIIGIVGPNGSGKSNIVDAVKWVLGEQSTKNLRANGKMTDVIFSGSKSRTPQTKASVTLVFNNDDHYLNCDFVEIEIKRALYNNGENEYFLNNSRVRLKDITDLFMDSGASKETFNIISQGTVQDIINMNSCERRAIFEEAAGVLKYKKRKEESLRKLEKTNENLTRINLITNELKINVEPLKIQSEVAKKYLEYKKELESIEIGLINNDITVTHEEYEKLNDKKSELENKILLIETINKKDTSKIEKLKLTNLKLEEKVAILNEKLIKVSDELSKLESDKQIAIERKKYQVEDIKLENNITLLKEERLILKNNIDLNKVEIDNLTSNYNKLLTKSDILNNDLNAFNDRRAAFINSYNEENIKINNLENKIKLLEQNLENDSNLSYAARNILNNPRLRGIHDALGKLIKVSKEYSIAIDTVLGANQNVIIVDNEIAAKEAINYLKENSLGRATFFPLNVIKSKYVESNLLSKLDNYRGFIGVASNLVNYDNKYKAIIENQLGNVIVVKDVDSLNEIGKFVDYRYRIVSLDGEILHTGGSITGGKYRQTNGLLEDRTNLITYEKDLSIKKNKLKELEESIKEINNEISALDEKKSQLIGEIVTIEEKISVKKELLQTDEQKYLKRKEELEGTKNVKGNKLDKDIESILEEYYAKEKEKEIISKDLEMAKTEKRELLENISNEEKEYREYNATYNENQKVINELEVKIGKMEVKLDNLLINLSDNYQMTYESIKGKYLLNIEPSIARLKVNSLKAEIKLLGEVNTGSIAEFERVNTRYEFLTNQSHDLEMALNNLEEIITEMDQIMIERFKDTFEKIKEEFKKVYKLLFRGGEGVLQLSEPDNILETGIEIKASPPGKKLNSIGLLSGGEKALTSLALLFAILNVKPAPFCILDEVEDALDDANVDVFGKYLNNIKEKTQFIIITHKKRTMEYADMLYGITMQESGVSKIVSVKLESI